MTKFIKNVWQKVPGTTFIHAQISKHTDNPEGLNFDRIRFLKAGSFRPKPDMGNIISMLRGKARLYFANGDYPPLRLDKGVHLYLPPGVMTVVESEPETELIHVSPPSAAQAGGHKIIIRNEKYLAACASGKQLLRWILTPQYLSRRIFLHHDQILLSKSGNPVSWFHTTMFDVSGLPENDEGVAVFKMSYNSRTEINICYEVKGTARVRMAQHPYQEKSQLWDPWLTLDKDSTYHLNETTVGTQFVSENSPSPITLRNRHEVQIVDGHVSLFCMFDPAPTGIENHQPGEYSDYEPLIQVQQTSRHTTFTNELAKFDKMVDSLSWAEATDKLEKVYKTPAWELYLQGRSAQADIETTLVKSLIEQGNKREQIINKWRCPSN